MKTLQNYTLLLALLTFSFGLFAQSPKKYMKTGEEFEESKSYMDAHDQFTKALDLDPKYVEAYVARARVSEKMFKINDAIEDYNRASTFDPDEEEYYYQLARLHLMMDQPKKGLEFSNKALEKKGNYKEALITKSESYIALDQYQNALEVADQVVDAEKSVRTYFLHGEVCIKLEDWGKAEFDFEKALKYDKANIDTYVALANAQVHLGKTDEAMATVNEGIEVDNKSAKIFVARAEVYKAKVDYPNAINDLSQALLLATPAEKNAIYVQRGTYYNDFGQSQGAINDFTKVIVDDPDNFEALYARAYAYETSTNYEAAMEDYEALLVLAPYDARAKELHEEASKRLFELNRESEHPQIIFHQPSGVEGLKVPVPMNLLEVLIHAQVQDKSDIKIIQVDGVSVPFEKEELNPEFKFRVHPKEKMSFELIVEDVYENRAVLNYDLIETEIDSPVVRILAPYASDDGEIYLDNNEPSLYIEGRIEDESLIKSITIDGATASYVVDAKNPSFSATLNITNKGAITITATDVYDNTTIQRFTFNREGAIIAANNPMGKTWVVFIENANYQNFASLEGPSKDVRTMKQALANYEIHNIIRKKDMTKSDFEKFFSIELRDLVRSNHVNSLLVWYAGHGKFLNETGYWIPVDARRDDEFTYFNINSLKAAMQSYSKYITHTLVITDACESGPSFYQAMRSTPGQKSCNDWESTRFKSSQVFSSAGYELASDDSQFTKTFANSLMNNPDECIPIEKIVSKVTEAVTKGGSQKPKFGKIAGFEDENGTFFFMKR